MKILMALIFIAVPAAAEACGMAGGQGGQVCSHAASVLYAVLAVLGYWVLQHAVKEQDNLVKKTGAVLGMVLVIIGLLGLLCGVGGHVKRGIASRCGCQGQGMAMHGCPEARGEMPAMSEEAKTPEPAKKITR
jgi:hypothetical protein